MLSCTWTIWERQRESVGLKFSFAVCVRVLYSRFSVSFQAQKQIRGTKRAGRLWEGNPAGSPNTCYIFCVCYVTFRRRFLRFTRVNLPMCFGLHSQPFRDVFENICWAHFFHLLRSLRPRIPMPAINKRTKGFNLLYFKAIISVTQTRTTPRCCRNVPIK